MTDLITINSRKFDYAIQRSWHCQLLTETPEYWLFYGEFEEEVRHSQLGVIRRGTMSFEYYFPDKWFNIFRFHEPGGEFKFFYCNLNLPPQFENRILDYVDLEIDVLVLPDFRFEVLDLEEFRVNSRIFQYPPELLKRTEQSLAELLEIIRLRQFPFDCKKI